MILGLFVKNVSAGVAVPSIFHGSLSENPATRLLVKSPLLLSLSINRETGEVEQSGYSEERSIEKNSFTAGAYNRTFFVDGVLHYQLEEEAEFKRTGFDNYSNEKSEKEFQLQIGKSFLLGDMAFK